MRVEISSYDPDDRDNTNVRFFTEDGVCQESIWFTKLKWKMLREAIIKEAAPIKEQPDLAQQTQAVICSNKVCDYCEGNDACLACDPAKGRDAFLGRKLTAC